VLRAPEGQRPGGAAAFKPLSTGITFALTDKTFTDKIPLVTGGYGLSASAEGRVFKYNFILGGSYWVAADIVMQAIGAREGGWTNSRARRLPTSITTRPTAKRRSRCCSSAARCTASSCCSCP
jgi:branched-chain amino acid transport system substrate-binding protein